MAELVVLLVVPVVVSRSGSRPGISGQQKLVVHGLLPPPYHDEETSVVISNVSHRNEHVVRRLLVHALRSCCLKAVHRTVQLLIFAKSY